jgi:hypothetical protein
LNKDCLENLRGNKRRKNALMMNAQQLRSNVECNTTKEKERLLDFVMAHQSVLFQVNKISLKSDCGSSNAKRKS